MLKQATISLYKSELKILYDKIKEGDLIKISNYQHYLYLVCEKKPFITSGFFYLKLFCGEGIVERFVDDLNVVDIIIL